MCLLRYDIINTDHFFFLKWINNKCEKVSIIVESWLKNGYLLSIQFHIHWVPNIANFALDCFPVNKKHLIWNFFNVRSLSHPQNQAFYVNLIVLTTLTYIFGIRVTWRFLPQANSAIIHPAQFSCLVRIKIVKVLGLFEIIHLILFYFPLFRNRRVWIIQHLQIENVSSYFKDFSFF